VHFFRKIKRSLFSILQRVEKPENAAPEKTRSEKGRFSRRKTQKRKKAHAAFLDRKMRVCAMTSAKKGRRRPKCRQPFRVGRRQRKKV